MSESTHMQYTYYCIKVLEVSVCDPNWHIHSVHYFCYSCDVYEIKLLASQVEKVLCFLYQSPRRYVLQYKLLKAAHIAYSVLCLSAFSLSTNKQQLDYLFGLLFEQLFTNKKSSSLQSFHFTPMMSLPANLKVLLLTISCV